MYCWMYFGSTVRLFLVKWISCSFIVDFLRCTNVALGAGGERSRTHTGSPLSARLSVNKIIYDSCC